MTKPALILVDLQVDFMPGGALAVGDGDEVVAIANERAKSSDYDFIVATQDWHPPGHASFASSHQNEEVGALVDLDGVAQILWPDHCVQGSGGASFHSSLDVAAIDYVTRKGTNPRIDSYSGFHDAAKQASTGLADQLRARGITDVHVMGLAMDYCVKFTALDALDEGFGVTLLEAGCRAVNLAEGDGDAAIAELRERGADIVRGD